jgi:hypothetical protein
MVIQNKNNEEQSIVKEITSEVEKGLKKLAKDDPNIKSEIKDGIKSERILELLYYKAEQPDIKRIEFIEHVIDKFRLSHKTAARYWNVLNYRGQQCHTMLLLIDQQYIKADREHRRQICADLLKLKVEVLMYLE